MRRSTFHLALALFACAAGSSAARAEEFRCVLTADDFEPRAVRVTKIDASTIEFTTDADGRRASLPIDRVVRLERATLLARQAPKSPPADAFVVLLRDGQRWIGKPGDMTGDDVAWRGDAGTRSLPLNAVDAIVSLGSGLPAATRAASGGPPRTQDELLLANGDVVAGVISASTPASVECTGADGTPTTVDWANVRVARFAATGAAERERRPFRLTLRDGSVVDGAGLRYENGKSLTLAIGDAQAEPRPVAATEIVSVEHRAGRSQMLADVAPASRTYAPFFPATEAAHVAVPRSPVTIGGHFARSFIEARPRTTIRWTLDGTAKRFVTRYGIPDGLALADATVRLKLDEAVVHERQHVRSGRLSELLKIDLGTAKSLTLEVDFGDGYDVQDALHWIEPALLPE